MGFMQPGRRGAVVLLLLAASFVVACGGDKTAARDAAATPRPSPSAVAAAGATATPGAPPANPFARANPSTQHGAIAAVAATPLASPLRPLTLGARVYLVGLEDFPPDLLDALANYYAVRHGIAVEVLPSISIPETAINTERRQLVAERLVELIASSLSDKRPEDVVIGFTQYDMMLDERPDWLFVFSERDENLRIAAISTTRMDPVNFGLAPEGDLLFARAAKMATKSVGRMYYGLLFSDNPLSVMYRNVTSLDDLDLMTDEFNPQGRR
jgi:predicted Zn-dependent protease